ncbi:MAG: hypothetical protein AB1451_01645 [Nitrospirota bacterium]
MDDREVKEFAKEALRHFGLQVEDIPPQPGRKTPDLLGRFAEGETFLFEVKAKRDDPDQVEEEERALDQGEAYSRSIPTGSRNTLSGIISDGVEQLVSYLEVGDAFRLLWLQCEGREAADHRRRFQSTLFGIQEIIDMDDATHDSRYCYYFGNSEFFRHRETLDGAIIFANDEIQLCVNTLSPRVEGFRRSKLVQVLAAGLCDPDALEARGEGYIVDGDIDRRDKNLVIGHLAAKYNRPRLIFIDMKHHTVKMRVPRSE